MIKHIVMWKLKDENKEENALKIKKDLEALKSEISEIKEIEVGIDVNKSEAAYDVVLYSTFDSQEDLDNYQVHPKHKEAGVFIRQVVSSRVVVDYEV
ncbi:Dabb family protein [Clostridium mediterraneense]|uniref:Dabb family protein n=1 Tax=Clostridium mediterraneense TaxID=1805472 RepID=UPI00082B1AB8|nr:Dabb family protein [Clostridium mediterraneense]